MKIKSNRKKEREREIGRFYGALFEDTRDADASSGLLTIFSWDLLWDSCAYDDVSSPGSFLSSVILRFRMECSKMDDTFLKLLLISHLRKKFVSRNKEISSRQKFSFSELDEFLCEISNKFSSSSSSRI